MDTTERLQIQIPLPYAKALKADERVRRQLGLGWRIVEVQRLSDQEVLITFEAAAS